MARKLETVLTAQDKTKAAFASVNRSIGSMKKGMAAVSVGVAALGVSFIAATKRSIALADSIDKASKATGVGTEALQRWRFVATQAGGTTEKFDAALRKLNKGIGEARQNTGTLATVIKRYDERLLTNLKNTKNTEQALDLVIDAMRNAKDAADASAIGSAAFGREFKTFAAISKMTKKEVDALAGSLKSVISQEAIDQGVRLADAMDKLQTEFDAGLSNAILENAGGLEELARQAGAAIPQLIEAGLEIARFTGLIDESAEVQLEKLTRERDLLKPIRDFREREGTLSDSLIEKKYISLTNRIERLQGIIDRQGVGDGGEGVGDGGEGGGDGGEGVTDRATAGFSIPVPGDAVEARLDMIKRRDDYQRQLDDAKALAMEQRRKVIDEEAAALLRAQDPLFAYNEERQRLNDLSIEFPEHSDVFRTALADLEYDFISASDTLEGSFIRAFEAMEKGFENIDYLSGDIFGQIGDLAKDAVNQIIAEFMRTQVLGPLLNGIFGGIFGGGGGFLGGLFGGARAEGGPVSGGTPYLVGEKGPEIFVPGSSGGIIPNNRIPSNDNGMTIIQHLHFDVGLESVEAKIREAEPRISRAAAAGVRDAQQRTGGAYL